MIGISPDVFWRMSVTEISLAIKGFSEFNGGGNDQKMDQDDLKKLMELYPDN
tara:strand:+ start:195 stop:350 length:156 start_codon:yes stop_codon:yes gene_type:complete